MKKPLLFGIILTVCVVIVAFVFSLGYPGGMISYWKFDVDEGTTTSDSVDANDGTIYGAQWTTFGKVNGALIFDGVDDYVQVNDDDSLSSSGGVTVEAWINAASFPEVNQMVVGKWNGGIREYEIQIWNGYVRFYASYGGSSYNWAESSTKLSTSTWYHVAGIFDDINDELRVYINGAQDGTPTSFSGPIPNSSSYLTIGAQHWYDYWWRLFDGIIDEVAIYNRALSAEEIQQHYENGSYEVACVPPQDNMVSWWPGDRDANDIVDGNNGTEYGATYAAGRVDQAFSFDGVDDYVEVPDADNLDITDELTIDAWFYNKGNIDPGMRWQRIIHKNYRKNYEMWIDDSDRKLSFRIGNGLGPYATLSSGTTIQFNIWYHVAAVYDGSSMKLYLNGDLSNSMTTTIAPLGITTDPVIIGNVGTDISSFNHNRPFKGLIDEVEIFNRALSQEEIQAIYFAGSAGKCKVIEVDIDIKPGSDPNCFNIDGHGNIPVAILGSADFDVLDIDFTTLSFEGMAVRVRGKRGPMCSFEDSNGDSFLDLVCHFEDDPEYWTGGDAKAKVTGELSDGKRFEGTDSICIVKIVE